MIEGPSATRRAVLLADPVPARRLSTYLGPVASELRDGVEELDVRIPRTATEAEHDAQAAVRSGADALIVLGGDELAHLAVGACAGSPTALAVLPTGAGDDVAATLWGPNTLPNPVDMARELAGLLGCGARRRFDLGRLRFEDDHPDGAAPQRHWWATALCLGSGSVAAGPGGPGLLRSDLSVLLAIAALTPRRVMVGTGSRRIELDALLVVVGNGRRSGRGLQLSPEARTDDGLLDVTVIGELPRRRLPGLVAHLYSGRHIEDPAVRTMRVDRVRIEAPGWHAWADGQPVGTPPLVAECVAGALVVVAP